jgi:hypothetical protein
VPLAYHYLFYSDEYGNNPALWARQADLFIDNADPAAIHVLDVEAAATSGHHLGVREWVAQYRRRLPNHPLGVYANRALWENRSRMPYSPAGLFDFVWHAGVGNGYYTSATGTIQAQWSAQGGLVNSFAAVGYPTVKLWQLTDHAKVSGVGGSFCDGNAFIGTLSELQALATGKAGDDMPLTDAEWTKLRGIVDDVVHDRLAQPWVNADALVDDTKTQISPLQMIEQAYMRAPGRLMNAKIGGTTVKDALLAAVAQTDTLEASEAAQSAALAGLNVDALATALAEKLTGGSGTLDAAMIRQAFDEVLTEKLPSVHLAVDQRPQ